MTKHVTVTSSTELLFPQFTFSVTVKIACKLTIGTFDMKENFKVYFVFQSFKLQWIPIGYLKNHWIRTKHEFVCTLSKWKHVNVWKSEPVITQHHVLTQKVLTIVFVLFKFNEKSFSDCDRSLTTPPSGILESPGYPHHYPNNRHCVYHITADDDGVVEITFEEFVLEYHEECTYDYVKVNADVLQNQNLMLILM